LIQIILTEGGFNFVHIKGQVVFKGEIIAKIRWCYLKKNLKNHRARKAQIYIKLLDMGKSKFIKIMVLGGQMGQQLGKTFLHKTIFEKKIFSKISRPMSIKLDANYLCMKVIQVSLNKGTDPHQRGDNHKNANMGWGI
jgi:hypothetical protein